MPESCDSACQKLLLDAGMVQIAAETYDRVIKRFTGLRAVYYEAPQMFIDFCGLCHTSAARFLDSKQLTAEQHDALIADLYQFCYQAGYILDWCRNTDSDIVDNAAGWTAKLFEWQKEHQAVFLELAKNLGSKK